MASRVTATKSDSKYLSLAPEVQESTMFTLELARFVLLNTQGP